MKTRHKAATSPTVRLILIHLSNPSTTTPASIEDIALAIGSPASSTRIYLQKMTREGILIRTLQKHTAYFSVVTPDMLPTTTPVNIPGTNRPILRLTHTPAPTTPTDTPPA
jgi:hypothetical protein